MAREPSTQTALILARFLSSPSAHGYQLMQETGLSSGTLYVILNRLYDYGFLEAEWENLEDDASGRPRRVYTLTEKGRRYAHRAIRGTLQKMMDKTIQEGVAPERELEFA